MIAKFHSAPGHSMETTLTISLPPPQSVRAARGEQPRKEKDKEKDKEKEREKKREREEKERQREQEREKEKEQREREWAREREREQKEQERERANKVHSERNVSYKDKFQRMREKYDKVTMSHETHQRNLEALNTKMKKLQAENDLLLDAMYLADPSLYHRYFPAPPGSTSPTLASASVPSFPQPSQPHLAHPQTYFSDPHTPTTPYPSSSQYSMPPPGSMPPPPLSSSATSAPPGSALSPMPPPFHSMHSPSTAMPPPSSASTNGTVTGGGRGSSSSRRPSNASSRSRRRSDARGGAGSSAGVPLAPEDITPPNGGRTPVRISTPIAGGVMDVEDLPLRSPRVNGSATGAAAMHERTSLSGGATPNIIPNGSSPSLLPRRQPEVPFPVPLRDEDIPEREGLPREPASIDDDPAYHMTAYAAVNSPDEPDEEEGKMQVDA